MRETVDALRRVRASRLNEAKRSRTGGGGGSGPQYTCPECGNVQDFRDFDSKSGGKVQCPECLEVFKPDAKEAEAAEDFFNESVDHGASDALLESLKGLTKNDLLKVIESAQTILNEGYKVVANDYGDKSGFKLVMNGAEYVGFASKADAEAAVDGINDGSIKVRSYKVPGGGRKGATKIFTVDKVKSNGPDYHIGPNGKATFS